MKTGWTFAAALLGIFAVWEVWRLHASANAKATSAAWGVTPYTPPTPMNPAGSFAAGISQTPYDPNAVQGT
jgi:hypothetical protein